MLTEDYIESRRAFIRDRRIALGKTLEDIGREVGVSKGTVQRWESGNISNMRRDKIAKLAAALEVSPTQLIGGEDTPTTKDGGRGQINPRYFELSADHRAAVDALIDSLAKGDQ